MRLIMYDFYKIWDSLEIEREVDFHIYRSLNKDHTKEELEKLNAFCSKYLYETTFNTNVLFDEDPEKPVFFIRFSGIDKSPSYKLGPRS